jgi:hypothetical protein
MEDTWRKGTRWKEFGGRADGGGNKAEGTMVEGRATWWRKYGRRVHVREKWLKGK